MSQDSPVGSASGCVGVSGGTPSSGELGRAMKEGRERGVEEEDKMESPSPAHSRDGDDADDDCDGTDGDCCKHEACFCSDLQKDKQRGH